MNNSLYKCQQRTKSIRGSEGNFRSRNISFRDHYKEGPALISILRLFYAIDKLNKNTEPIKRESPDYRIKQKGMGRGRAMLRK